MLPKRREREVEAMADATAMTRYRVDLDRQMATIEHLRTTMAEKGTSERINTIRAVASILEDTHLEARVGRYHLEADEPPERGGDDHGPAPLQYMIAGVAFCLLTQVARFAPLYAVEIEDATADVRARLRSTEKYDVDDASPYFEGVTIDLQISSPAPPARVAELVAHAERGCHASQSLRFPIPVTLSAALNGSALDGLAPDAKG